MYKVKVVPCLLEDVNNNEKNYIYHVKGAHKKGGNRFCTILYHAVMSAKRSERPSSKARVCYIIGDNYGENRNKLNLRFASEVVMRGLYDEVIFLYGVLGHTHFGIDREHSIHNRANAHNFSVTLADWVRSFGHSWQLEKSDAPKGVINGHIYDWEKRYSPYAVDITGMNKRMNDMPGKSSGSFSVTSFKVAKSNGHVVVKYRSSSNYRHPFLGDDGTPTGKGWVVLRQPPRNVPVCKARVKHLDNEDKILSDLNTVKFRYLIKSQFRSEEAMNQKIAALQTYVKNKEIPVTAFQDDEVAPGRMGRLANIASSHDEPVWVGCMEPVPEETTIEQFWHVPIHSLRVASRAPLVQAREDVVPIKYKRKADQLAELDQLQVLEEPVPNVPDAVSPLATQASKKKRAIINAAVRTQRTVQRNRQRARKLTTRVDDLASASESSADDKKLPTSQKLVGQLVYVADLHTKQVWKGRVQGKQPQKSKKSGPAQWLVDFHEKDGRVAYAYNYKELYATRKQATAALVGLLAQSDSDSDKAAGNKDAEDSDEWNPSE